MRTLLLHFLSQDPFFRNAKDRPGEDQVIDCIASRKNHDDIINCDIIDMYCIVLLLYVLEIYVIIQTA